MSTARQPLNVVQSIYAAFGSGDVQAILALLADDVDWKFYGARGLPYTGAFRGKSDVANWFANVARSEDIQAFEPREFLDGSDHVTVLGWERTRNLPAGKTFETDWVHVFTVRNGLVARYWGMYDTQVAAAAM